MNLFVTTSLQLSEEGANFSSSHIYHSWRAPPQNRLNVFEFDRPHNFFMGQSQAVSEKYALFKRP